MSKSQLQKVCEACRGQGLVPHVVLSDQGERVQFLSQTLPVLGYVIDRSCRFCDGTGLVTPESVAKGTRLPQPKNPSS